MSAQTIDTALTEFVRATGQIAARAGTFRLSLYDFEQPLASVSERLGSQLRAEDLEVLREASHQLAYAVGRDPATSTAHMDFRAAVEQVKSDVTLRALGAAHQ